MPVWGLQTCSRQQVGVQDERRDGGLCRRINLTECNSNQHTSAYAAVWQRRRLTGGAGGGVACGGQRLHVPDQNTGGGLQMWKSSGGQKRQEAERGERVNLFLGGINNGLLY